MHYTKVQSWGLPAPTAEGPAAGSNELDRLLANLGARGTQWQMISGKPATDGRSQQETAGQDLLVYLDTSRSWWHRLRTNLTVPAWAERSAASLLFVRQPRWPIQRILLVARAEASDFPALEWAMRIANPTRTRVSILPVVPPWPGLHRFSRYVQPPPNVLLAPNTVSGAVLHGMMGELRRRHVPTDLVLCTGEPECRLRDTVSSRDPDLVIVAAESHHRLLRCLFGELVCPMLRWIDRPVLIAGKAESGAPRGSR